MTSRKRTEIEGREAPPISDIASTDDPDASTFEALLREAVRISEPVAVRHRALLSPGRTLKDGRFQLVRRIGAGGMGEVHEALDRERQCKVALKTFTRPGASSLYMLKNEFRSLADITHPCLIHLHELFYDDEDLWFFTMDLIEGQHFDQWVRPDDVLDPGRLRLALPQLVAAVNAIHAGGKLHRDLKPSNVLVTVAGKLLVLDFGLAVPLDQRGAAYGGGQHGASGTPAYMAPEQAAGTRVSAASDWYALGVMLFEALTGQLPFSGQVHEMLQGKQQRDAPAPSDLNPEAPSDLDALCRALLVREPAQRPDGETLERLLGRSRAAEAWSLPARASIGGVAPALRGGAMSVRPEPVLLGREVELETLRAAYRETLLGKAAVVFVSGDSGIGKSALLEAFLAELRADGVAVVLEGRCYERESVPYKAFDSLIDDLSSHLLRLDRSQVGELMPRDVSALTRLFPVLNRIDSFERAPGLAIPDAQELRRRAFGAFTELTSRICESRPLVACIDDLQWIDTDSTSLLRHLLGESQPVPALLVVSYRSGADRDGGPLQPVLDLARGNDRVLHRSLHLGPLPPDAARRLAQRLLEVESEELADRVAHEAQGSPFLLRELCRRVRFGAEPALTLQAALIEHVERLSPAARELLRVVAVAGTPLLDVLAIEAASTNHEAIDELRGQQLLRRAHSASPRKVECYHDKIRENVVSALGPDVLRGVHAKLVEVLLASGDADAEQLAVHCEGAGAFEQAAHYAVLAADAAHKKLAFARAAELYRRALQHWRGSSGDKLELERKLAEALSDGGRGAEAAPRFMAVARRVAPAQALELRRRAAEQWLVSGRTEEGLHAFADVLRAVGLRLHRSPQTAFLDLLLTRLRLQLRGLQFRSTPETSVPAHALARIDVCKTAWSLSFVSTIRAAAFQARHLLYALDAGEPYRIAIGLGMEAVYASLSGLRSEKRVRALLAEAERLASGLGNDHAEAFMHLARGQSSYLLARWRPACESLSKAEAILTQRCSNVAWELNSVRFFLGNALEFRGELKTLRERIEAWLKDASDRGDLYASATLSLVRARLTLAAGDPAAARSEVELAVKRWQADEFGVQQFLAVITEVQIDLYEGRAEGAWDRMVAMWPVFFGSLMSRIQICRVPAHQHAGYAALAMAAQNPGDARWTRRAATHARALRREKMPMAAAFALQIDAAIAHLHGQPAVCRDALALAVAALDEVELDLYTAACRRHLGVLLGGDGGVLVTAADERMASQGVAAPHAYALGLAPGMRGL